MSAAEPPLDELQWRAPEWIAQWGLRTDNVLEYFAQSPFYDRSSNNQVLKMQSQFSSPMMQPQDVHKLLESMRGIEFAIAIPNPGTALWVIRKQNRISQTEAIPLATYFVIEENIYMAPTVYSVVSSRIMACSKELTEALAIAADKLPNFSPTTGYSYSATTLEDDESAKLRLQDQMMARALTTAFQFESGGESVYLDAPQKLKEPVMIASQSSGKGRGSSVSAGEKSTPAPPPLKRRKTKKSEAR
ncbi:putative MED6 mediator subfamily complex component [Myxozyma melibiosi]|uniref:Mediator of RNA polymerase II transcription subunit 6 n=1 Tax=Myxozyma melibiosi TaxID=54550 RepID=A0ABR1FE66_9ASCO